MTYWSRTSFISCGDGTCVIASDTSRSSSSARISLHRAMHSLQMYTEGPEMNLRTESLDLPQKEQRRCLSWDIDRRQRPDHPPLRSGGLPVRGFEGIQAHLQAAQRRPKKHRLMNN